MKAHANKQPEIASIVKKLAVLMRRNLEVSNKLVTLESELELVINYLEIQKFRFGERVSYKIDVRCDIEEYRVLPLLLQPVVENAIVHGLENKEGNGFINIIIERREPFLTIAIIDNGIGIDNDKLKLLNNKINSFTVSGKQSIGLSNVNQRIKLFYGDDYYVKLESEVNIGTQIFLYLPSREDEFYNVKSTFN
jgi:Putative regulator of cell autolysis